MGAKEWAILTIFILVGLLILATFITVYSLPDSSSHFAPTVVDFGPAEGECTSGTTSPCFDADGCPGTKTCTHSSWSPCMAPHECTPGETQFCSLGTCDSGVQKCNSCGQWGACTPR